MTSSATLAGDPALMSEALEKSLQASMSLRDARASSSSKKCCKYRREQMKAAEVTARRVSAHVSMAGEVDEEELSFWQRLATRILVHPWFQVTMTVIIILHMGLTVQLTDQHARKEKATDWQDMCERFFLFMYWVDILLRLFTLRRSFLKEKMNLFDLSIVALDTIMTVLEAVSSGSFDLGPISLLRALRALRIVRVIRNFATFRELYLMMKGMGGAMRAIFFAFLLILVTLTMFSIAAVEMMDTLNQQLAADGAYDGCKWCHRAFSSVAEANLTFFASILAGDSWGQLAIPLINASPTNGFIIISAFVILELGLLNVIIAVVVDRQAQAREADKDLMHTVKEEQAQASYKELLDLFKEMDDDSSGSLSAEELCEAFGKYETFRTILSSIDVSVDDLTTVFASMDRDKGGTVDYEEFVAEVHRMRTMEIRTLVYLTRQHVLEVKESLKLVEDHIFGRLKDPNSQMPFPGTTTDGLDGIQKEKIKTASWMDAPAPCTVLLAESNKAPQTALVADAHLRLVQLEHQFASLETRVEETARFSQQRINDLASGIAADGAGGCDAQKPVHIKMKRNAKDSFADEVVPELTPSGTAAPGRDLHFDNSEVTHDTDQRSFANDLTISRDGPKRQANLL